MRIFLSHSSANNAEAVAIRKWLADEGWDDVYFDLDPKAASPQASGGSALCTRPPTAARRSFFLYRVPGSPHGASRNSISRIGSTNGCDTVSKLGVLKSSGPN